MQEIEILAELSRLFENFTKVSKRILQNRPVSNNKAKIHEYITLLRNNYNDLVNFYAQEYQNLETGQVDKINKRVDKVKQKLLDCGVSLNHNFYIPSDFSALPISIAEESDCEFKEATSEIHMLFKTESLPDNINKLSLKNEGLEKGISDTNLINSEHINLQAIVEQRIEKSKAISANMATAEQKRSFITMCSSIIRNKYDGNPLSLDSFIDEVNLLEELTDDNLKPTLLRFIVSKLEGKARESLPENVSSVDSIKSSLRSRIRPDNSKVVSGKIAALQIKNNNYSDFAKQMEELADALERSLIGEGITQQKAHDIAIEQTITTCRANANSDLVQAIIASTKFSDPKDVVARLIIEQTEESNKKNVLKFNAANYQGNTLSYHNAFKRNNASDHQYNNRNFSSNRHNYNVHSNGYRSRNSNQNNRNYNNYNQDYNNRSNNYNQGYSRSNNLSHNQGYNRSNNFSHNGSNRFQRQNNLQRDGNVNNPTVRFLNMEDHQQAEAASEEQ